MHRDAALLVQVKGEVGKRQGDPRRHQDAGQKQDPQFLDEPAHAWVAGTASYIFSKMHPVADALFSGKYEDLIALVLRLELRKLEREKHVLPAKPRWKRRLFEFPLNLAAAGYAVLLKM